MTIPIGCASRMKSPSAATLSCPFGKPQFPAYKPPDGSSPSAFLRQLVLQGLHERYGPRAGQFHAQAMEELGIINDVGYEEYFLITWDFLQECRRQNIDWITRGSAADSLVCYCLGISGVCPIRFDLYFRRFLNKERMALHKLPDIDIDFAHDVKDDVVKIIFKKYGRDQCGGGRFLHLSGAQCVCRSGQGVGRGGAGGAQVHRTFPLGIWRRLGAG
jgi:DNA polymerase III alpha subunit